MIELTNGMRAAAVKRYSLPPGLPATDPGPQAGRDEALAAGDGLLAVARAYMATEGLSFEQAWAKVKADPALAEVRRQYAAPAGRR